MNYWTQSKENIYVAAHRGFSEVYPENTMEAFIAAAELGVDQIETDIRLSKDRELVLIHDATVDRTTDGVGNVCDMTLAELKALDAGIKKGEQFRGARIPTLIEFLDYIKTLPEMTVDLELKLTPASDAPELAYETCDRILALVDEYGLTDRCVINTFSGVLHEYIQEKYADKYRRHIYYPIRSMGRGMRLNPYATGAYCCCVFSSDVRDYDFVRAYGVRAWGGASIKDEETLERAIEFGVELITCNNPDRILSLLRAKNLHK